jgi:hypothetical protein
MVDVMVLDVSRDTKTRGIPEVYKNDFRFTAFLHKG